MINLPEKYKMNKTVLTCNLSLLFVLSTDMELALFMLKIEEKQIEID